MAAPCRGLPPNSQCLSLRLDQSSDGLRHDPRPHGLVTTPQDNIVTGFMFLLECNWDAKQDGEISCHSVISSIRGLARNMARISATELKSECFEY